MFVAHLNGRCVETCANIKLFILLTHTNFTKENIIQYCGTWYGFDYEGFATMSLNLSYLHIYDSEFDDEETDEDCFEEPWVANMCGLMTPIEITLKVNHFCSKKMMYNKYYSTK